jgi:hypothetical protein
LPRNLSRAVFTLPENLNVQAERCTFVNSSRSSSSGIFTKRIPLIETSSVVENWWEKQEVVTWSQDYHIAPVRDLKHFNEFIEEMRMNLRWLASTCNDQKLRRRSPDMSYPFLPYSSNDLNIPAAERYRLNFTDFYVMPHVII